MKKAQKKCYLGKRWNGLKLGEIAYILAVALWSADPNTHADGFEGRLNVFLRNLFEPPPISKDSCSSKPKSNEVRLWLSIGLRIQKRICNPIQIEITKE